jgi:hypothetical protein
VAPRPLVNELDNQTLHALADLIAAGIPAVVAARELGISERSYYRWKQRGLKGGPPIYTRFWSSVQEAQDEHREQLRKAIELARQQCHRAQGDTRLSL